MFIEKPTFNIGMLIVCLGYKGGYTFICYLLFFLFPSTLTFLNYEYK
jgi:hypothetical protein